MNPCRCGSDNKPVYNSSEVLPYFTLKCNECDNVVGTESELWTSMILVDMWNARNPKKHENSI